MAGNYAWRDCAGRTSDAIQFATQMGFVERKDGNWYLSLGEMLRFFGGSDKPECYVRDQWTNTSSGPISWKQCKVYCAQKITPGDARGVFYFLTYSVAINLSVLIVLVIEKSSYVYSLSSSADTIIQKSFCSAIKASLFSR